MTPSIWSCLVFMCFSVLHNDEISHTAARSLTQVCTFVDNLRVNVPEILRVLLITFAAFMARVRAAAAQCHPFSRDNAGAFYWTQLKATHAFKTSCFLSILVMGAALQEWTLPAVSAFNKSMEWTQPDRALAVAVCMTRLEKHLEARRER